MDLPVPAWFGPAVRALSLRLGCVRPWCNMRCEAIDEMGATGPDESCRRSLRPCVGWDHGVVRCFRIVSMSRLRSTARRLATLLGHGSDSHPSGPLPTGARPWPFAESESFRIRRGPSLTESALLRSESFSQPPQSGARGPQEFSSQLPVPALALLCFGPWATVYYVYEQVLYSAWNTHCGRLWRYRRCSHSKSALLLP